MQVYIEREDRQETLTFAGAVGDLLKTLCILHEEVLVVKGDTILTEDDAVADADQIKILSVISGG